MHHPLARALEGISKAGFKYVELLSIPQWIAAEHVNPKLNFEEIERIRALIKKHNLAPISLSGHVDFLVKDPEDPSVPLNALTERIKLASRLGCKYVNTGGWTNSEQIFYDTVPEVIDECEKFDIVLGLEVGEPGLTATGKRLMRLLELVKSERIGVNYDTGNIRWLEGIEPEIDLASTLTRLVHFHIKDQVGGKASENFPALGKGEINLARIMDILRKDGYGGPITVEIENPIKSLFERDHDVRECFEFMQQELENIPS